MAILEREDDVRRLAALTARARAGEGGIVLLEGPAGIGKTALLAAVRADAAAAGMGVLHARASPLEREFAFGIVRQLFEPVLARDGGEVTGAAALAVERLDLRGAGPGEGLPTPDASFAVLHGLYWLCADLAQRRPLLIAIDDAHWADAASLRFLAFLATRIADLPVVICAATRDGPDAAAVAELAADTATALLRPAPLSAAAVEQLLAQELGAPPEPAFATACRATTGGTPFLVRQLAQAVHAAGIAPVAASAEAVAELGARGARPWILARLARLSAPAGALARALAVLERAPLPLTAALAELPREAAADAADELCAAHLATARGELAFVHAVVRTAVLQDLAPAERSRAHRRAAELLSGPGGTDERIADHLLATTPAADPWVSERLAAAAGTATRAGAPETAITLLERALAEPPPAAERSALLRALGLAQMALGRPEAEDRLADAAAAAVDPHARLEAALTQVHLLARGDRCGEALALLDRVAAGVDDPGLSDALEVAAVSVGMLDASTGPGLAARALRLRESARAPGAARDLLAVGAYLEALASVPARDAAALARRALADGAMPSADNPPWFPQSTIALIWSEADAEARTALDAGGAEARRTGNGALFAQVSAHRAWSSLRCGDLAGAELDARAALQTPELPAPPLYTALACGVLVLALVEQGYLLHAEAALAPFADALKVETQTAAVLRFARGQLRLAQHRVPQGLEDLRETARIMQATGAQSPGYLAWRSALAVAMGPGDAARTLAAEGVERARVHGGPRTLGIALRAAGLLGDDEELLREALALHARAGGAVELARTQMELGALLRRAKRRAEAQAILREALDAATRARAGLVAERAEAELRATGARPRRLALSGVDSLTASEKRVAALAADGMTNREIAQSLYVTARTVEGHLTAAFRKLDVSSRDALGSVLGPRGMMPR